MSLEPRRLVKAMLGHWKTLDGTEDFMVDAMKHMVLCFTD